MSCFIEVLVAMLGYVLTCFGIGCGILFAIGLYMGAPFGWEVVGSVVAALIGMAFFALWIRWPL